MIDTPTDNVKLTFEQMQQIDVVEKRLVVLKNEITISQNLLMGTRMETDRATKEREYQEELLSNLQSQVEDFSNKKDALVLDINSSIEINDKLKLETTKMNEENHRKISEIVSRENELKIKEENFNKRMEDFNIKSSQLLEDQLSIKTAKDAFLKATEAVVW